MNLFNKFLNEEVFKKACEEIEITKIVGSALEETLKNLFMEEFEKILLERERRNGRMGFRENLETKTSND